MPSLRTLDVVHRLNSPTRAAAARRRRLRKAVAIMCFLLAAVVMPGGSATKRSSSVDAGALAGSRDATNDAPLRGRHALSVRSLTPVRPDATRVDVWDGAGARLARCAPTLNGGDDATPHLAPSTTDAVVTVALTDAEVTAVSHRLASGDGQSARLIVSTCL